MARLQVRDITKRFGAFTALDGVSLAFHPGTVTALLGENGAGKSTLMKICYGMLRPDAGALAWDGEPVTLPDPAAARRLGIGMVHQHFTLVPAMTVAENLALAVPPDKASPRAMVASANRLMEATGLHADPSRRAADLPVGVQQRVEILKALGTSARLLILDEPTGVLAPDEVADLFRVLRGLRDKGTALVLITHKLPEALDIADRVAVLRRGRLVLDAAREEVDADVLARAMVGRSLGDPVPLPPVETGPVVLETSMLAGPDAPSGRIHAGEVVGIAGVEGNGQTELAETIVGLRHEGSVYLDLAGSLCDASGWSIERRLEWGMAHIPEDRHATALALAAPVLDNLYLAGDTIPRRGPWIRREEAGSRGETLMREYDVRAPSPSTPVSSLSGGNQQKIVVARELSRIPRLLVAVNPTRGLDVAATEFVHNAIRQHRHTGGATVLVSSEIDELLALSDRVLVMYRGQVAGCLEPGGPDDRERLGRLMAGLDREHETA